MAGMVSRIVGAAIIAAGATGLMGAAAPEAGVPHLLNGLPDFSSAIWVLPPTAWNSFRCPVRNSFPVTNDPAHPFCGNRRMAKCGNQILPPYRRYQKPDPAALGRGADEAGE
jgi:hypothetical protein